MATLACNSSVCQVFLDYGRTKVKDHTDRSSGQGFDCPPNSCARRRTGRKPFTGASTLHLASEWSTCTETTGLPSSPLALSSPAERAGVERRCCYGGNKSVTTKCTRRKNVAPFARLETDGHMPSCPCLTESLLRSGNRY
eukprot:1408320-Amphidinium_carterae.1